MKVVRHFTRPGESPFNLFEWKTIRVGESAGKLDFHEIEVPALWSNEAAFILATRYCFRFGHDGGESSLRQVINRMVLEWTEAAREYAVFESEADVEAFADELRYLICDQRIAPNSPQWFSSGIGKAYGVTQSSSGFYFVSKDGEPVKEAERSLRPLASACFIFSVEDDLLGKGGIMHLFTREARAYKYGAGVGTNVSTLRALGEPLSAGGCSSGLMSFLNLDDRLAGVIRQGGAFRRAARMICLNADHPEVMEFIRWKSTEEKKAKALIDAGYSGGPHGEAIQTVSGQNVNISIRLSDEYMRTLEQKQDWNLMSRTGYTPPRQIPAEHIFNAIVDSAWECGDPGVQFDTTINMANSCPAGGKIRGSNPCAEFLFLDDSACNLASLNLMKFVDESGRFDNRAFTHSCRLLTILLDLTISFSRYPDELVALNSAAYRPVGLGYAGLGAMLMSLGIPYDSDEGRGLASSISALMQATALCTSSELAARLGPFLHYKENSERYIQLIEKQRRLLGSELNSTKAKKSNVISEALNCAPNYICEAAIEQFDWALDRGKTVGFRNAMLTAIAPTGTIGLLMDAGTGGIEPEFAHVRQRWVEGKSDPMRTISTSISAGLVKLGYNPQVIEDSIGNLKKSGNWFDVELIRQEHFAVFAVASAGADSPFYLPAQAHLAMMAVVQPFIGGGISKTVNLPRDARKQEIADCIVQAWKLGLKSVAFYRIGSKVFEPVLVGDRPETAECSAC